jgi:hypothetical protein
MYRFSIFVLLLIVLSNSIVAQEKIVRGRIIDADTKKPIPYVNIGVFHKNIGTVSDEKGQFKFGISDNSITNDSILFSHIGYQTSKYSISQLVNPIGDIQLSPASNLLQEVIIKPKKTVKKFFGRNGKGLGLMHYNFYTYYELEVDDRLGKEVGILVSVKKNCFLNELQMHISSNEFSSLKFRLNFYKVVDGIPVDLINMKEVIFEIKNEFVGLYKLDLIPYDIFLNKEMGEIVVSIQWVESAKANPKSKYFSLYSSLSPNSSCLSRTKSMAKWEKSKQDISLCFLSECD